MLNKARKVYEDEMAEVAKYRIHELAELNKQKTYAQKNLRDIVDELDRRHKNMVLTVQNRNQNAMNKKIRVETEILREFNRNQEANANIKRESSYPTFIPPRETPRHPREEPYVPPPHRAPPIPPRETPRHPGEKPYVPYTAPPQKAPHIPHRETNTDFKEAYETTERGYYYRVLGLAPGSSQEEVKKAYKVKVKIYHPDKKYTVNYSQQNQAYMWTVIQKANEILGKEYNLKLKEKYDKYGNEDGWVKRVTNTSPGVEGALKNKCYNLSGYNPYIVIQ